MAVTVQMLGHQVRCPHCQQVVRGQFQRTGVPVIRILLQRLEDDGFQLRGNGFLVPPRWRELVGPLIRLAADSELRTCLGGTGRNRFTQQFRHEFMTKRIRELYERVLNLPLELTTGLDVATDCA
jgi:hypothetical protein